MRYATEEMKQRLLKAKPGSKWGTWHNNYATMIGPVPSTQRMLTGAHYVLMDERGDILLVDEYGRDRKWSYHLVAPLRGTPPYVPHPLQSDDVGSGP